MNNASYQTPIHTTNTPTPRNLYLVNQNSVFCIDADRGKTIWQQPVPGQRLWDNRSRACCCQLQVLNQVVYVLLDFDVYALDARTGQEIWHASNPENRLSLTFAIDHYALYQTTLNLDGFKDEPGPVTTDDTNIRALQITDGSLAWQTTTFHPQRDTGFTLRKATIYTLVCRSKGFSDRGRANIEWQLYAVDTLRGETRWHVSLGNYSTLIAEEGKVYAFVDRQGIVVLDEQTGREIWHWSGWSVVGIARIEDLLFINSYGLGSKRDQRAFAFDHRTGQQIWIKQDCELAPLTSDGLFPAIREKTTRLDVRTGKPFWEPPVLPHASIFQSYIVWSDVLEGHWVFLEDQFRRQDERAISLFVVKMMDLDTGTLLSERILLQTKEMHMTFLQQNNGLLYFYAHTQTVYTLSALHLATGELAWNLDIPIPSGPRVPSVHAIVVSAPVLAP